MNILKLQHTINLGILFQSPLSCRNRWQPVSQIEIPNLEKILWSKIIKLKLRKERIWCKGNYGGTENIIFDVYFLYLKIFLLLRNRNRRQITTTETIKSIFYPQVVSPNHPAKRYNQPPRHHINLDETNPIHNQQPSFGTSFGSQVIVRISLTTVHSGWARIAAIPIKYTASSESLHKQIFLSHHKVTFQRTFKKLFHFLLSNFCRLNLNGMLFGYAFPGEKILIWFLLGRFDCLCGRSVRCGAVRRGTTLVKRKLWL